MKRDKSNSPVSRSPTPGLIKAITPRAAPFTIAAAALVLMAPLTPALAQEADDTLEEQLQPPFTQPRFTFSAEGGFVYQTEADIDGGGSVQVNRYDAAILLNTPLSEQLRWLNTFSMGVNDYDFSGGGFSAGNPWETILFNRFGTQLAYSLNERWAVRGGGVFMFSRETDSDLGSSFTGGGMLGVDYTASKTFFVSLGLAGISQIEDDAELAASIGLNWMPSEKWTIRVGAVPVSGGTAAAAEAEYKISEPLEVGLGLLYNQRRFRLDDSGIAPDGVGEENSLPLRLRVGWNINEHISLHFIGGVAVNGRLRLEDEDGNRLNEQDYDPAAFFGLRVAGRF